jgi:hypothetical protein
MVLPASGNFKFNLGTLDRSQYLDGIFRDLEKRGESVGVNDISHFPFSVTLRGRASAGYCSPREGPGPAPRPLRNRRPCYSPRVAGPLPPLRYARGAGGMRAR